MPSTETLPTPKWSRPLLIPPNTETVSHSESIKIPSPKGNYIVDSSQCAERTAAYDSLKNLIARVSGRQRFHEDFAGGKRHESARTGQLRAVGRFADSE